MKKTIPNPFAITKSAHLNDQQLNDLWVELINKANGNGVNDLIKPVSLMPTLFLGGKGSGKTHILKHFTYTLQKIRHSADILKGVLSDGYIGVFIRLGGFEESRFRGKHIDNEVWRKVFVYYMDVSVAQMTLMTLQNFIHDAKIAVDEHDFSTKVSSLFDKNEEFFKGESISELIAKLEQIRKDISYKVNNSALTRTIDVDILATESRLIFELPKIILKSLGYDERLKILFLFDELENVSFEHQRYIQNVIRMSQEPVSIKIGSRLYGIKTYQTYCGYNSETSESEENKEGAEFEKVYLDRYLRSAPTREYLTFFKKLCLKRLERDFPHVSEKNIEHCFLHIKANPSDRFMSDYFSFLGKSRARRYMVRLNKNLLKAKCPQDVVNYILSRLREENYPLVEKTSTFIFYKEWARQKPTYQQLTAIAEQIRESASLYQTENYKYSEHYKVLSHFKSDMVAQIMKEHFRFNAYKYAGIDNFITISCGLPRNLLRILKNTFLEAIFNNEEPFKGSIGISYKAQELGLRKACEWFFDEALDCRESEEIKDAIHRLGELLAEMRFSDKPSDCSALSFCVNEELLTGKSRQIIKMSTERSLLIRIGRGRKDKNSFQVLSHYKLNPMFSLYWRLPITHRSPVSLSTGLANSIFDDSCKNEYASIKRERLSGMNAPFFISEEAPQNSFSNILGLEFND